jgi:hypothetical protein
MTNSKPSENSGDSLQLSIADKIVLRAEGRLAIIVAAAMVVATASLWLFAAVPFQPAATTTSAAQ